MAILHRNRWFLQILAIVLFTTILGCRGTKASTAAEDPATDDSTSNSSTTNTDNMTIDQLGLTVGAGAIAGTVMLIVDFPDNAVGFVDVKILRVEGSTPPPATCDTGDVIATLTTFADISMLDHTAIIGKKYSYRACISYDGGMYTSDTITAADVNSPDDPYDCYLPPCQIQTGRSDFSSFSTVSLNGGIDTAITQEGLLVDLNGDGYLDLVSAGWGSSNTIRLSDGDPDNNGTVTFGSPIIVHPDTGNYSSIAAGDFNRDGNKDLVFATNGAGVHVYFGDGNGNFPSRSASLTAEWVNTLAVGDFNRDNKLDILLGIKSATVPAQVMLGDGLGGFTAGGTLATEEGEYTAADGVAIGDLDGDGDLDVVTTQDDADARIHSFLNDGSGNFTRHSSFNGPSPFHTIRLADFNNDGKLDYVASHMWEGFHIAAGNGDGTFAAHTNISVDNGQNNGSWLEVADFNADGNADVLVGIDQDGTKLYLGNGDLTFPTNVVLEASGGSDSAYQVSIGDINKDGYLDVFEVKDYDAPADNVIYFGGN